MWDSRTATSRVPDSLPALQVSAIKELLPPPPPAVLLNKQGRSKSHRNRWAKTRRSHGGEGAAITPLVVRLFYVSGSVDRFKRRYFDCDLWPSGRLCLECLLTSLPLVSDVKEGQTNWGRKCWGCVCGERGGSVEWLDSGEGHGSCFCSGPRF